MRFGVLKYLRNCKDYILHQRQAMPELQHWTEGWAVGRTTFHRSEVHDYLLKFQEKLLVKKPSRVLVPLCGKSVDMKWLADEGHEVVGVEGVLQGVKEFFQEQGLTYKESEVPGLEGATVCQTEDGKIKLYVCDFFKFSRDIAGEFDAIWDRGALVAVDPCDRQKYADILLSVLAPGGRILSEVFFYNPEERIHKGPPYSVPEDDMNKLFSVKCTMELLADNEYLEKNQRFKERGLTWMRQHIRIINLK